MTYRAIFLACFIFSIQGLAHATVINGAFGVEWASYRDLTKAQFSQRFSELRDQGMIPVDVDAYPTRRGLRYAMVWRENRENRRWALYRDMSSEGFNQRWREFRDQGYRPLDVDTYKDGSNRRWSGIWIQNQEGYRWASYRNQTNAQYRALVREQSDAGLRMIDVDVYSTANGLRYSTVWVQNRANVRWIQSVGMSESAFQREDRSRRANGYRIVDIEAYETSSGVQFAAIWERVSQNRSFESNVGQSTLQFANSWRTLGDVGYRLVDIEPYRTANGTRYAGVWIENDRRFRYPRKRTIDGLIRDYRAALNVPGLSVAIIKDGEEIYRRGSGFADIARRRTASSRTIYPAASVSKSIGGVLAVKLEDEGKLRDGRQFFLDMRRPTSEYIRNIRTRDGRKSLPTHHTHKVEHLFSNLSCIRHYPGRNRPGIPNQTKHYTNATDAMMSIWQYPLVGSVGGNRCVVGSTYSYSTHAYTFGAAVLERATGKTINQLLNDELFKPYNLGAMRVQYATASLPPRYDRAAAYRRLTIDGRIRNELTEHENSSWTVLGGGIEASARDLARFGWKVLNGEIVRPAVRDGRLWRRVASNRIFGIGWSVVQDPSRRRVAQWNGQQRGARSFLRVYRDDGLVIAVMSNRDGHCLPRPDNTCQPCPATNALAMTCNIDGLVNRIGAEVLRP